MESARLAQDTTPAQDTARRASPAADTLAGDSVAGRLGAAALSAALPPIARRELPQALRAPRFRLRFADWSGAWARRVEGRLAAAQDSLWAAARPEPEAAPPVALAPEERAAPPEPRRAPGAQEPGGILPEAIAEYADLEMQVHGRFELGGGWNRFRPCDVSLRLSCNPSAIPNLKPDLQFGLRVGGTVSDRVHVNVDYDNAREFDAANNINVYYQGLEDEILQRFEVGDVSFSLPRSRYLTRAIPAGNFGFRATGQLGPLEFQTIWAQQKGDLGTRTFNLSAGGQGFVQDQSAILDDADYQRGQFFFLFHPRHIFGYPHVDILQLAATAAPAAFQPASTIKLYRYEGAFRGSPQGSVQENTIEAIAVALDTVTTAMGDSIVAVTLSGTFRVLEESKDYLVHRSGLWVMLRSPVGATEGLATVYKIQGGEVGTFNAESIFAAHVQDSTRPLPVLELLKDANHRPGEPTWEREMHNVYRVSGGSGVDLSSVELVISQGDVALDQTFRLAPSGTPINLLKIFGLDDEPSDEALDRAHIYQPTTEDPTAVEGGPAGTYIVFPTLRPFLDPPLLQGLLGSDATLNGQPFPLDPGDENATIYEDPLDVRRQGTNLYRLTLGYRTRSDGVVSSFSVGGVGIREGSERITIGGTSLQRGTDYDIDYSTGRVDLRDPDKWFGGGGTPQVQVTYEQKPLFQLAPTSVFGFNARTQFGRTGELNFVGLAQTEKSLQTRPELGLEPGAIKLAGVSGRFQWESAWLTRMVDALPFVSAEQGSAIQLEGELATSLPTTNTTGVTYVDDFEGGTGFDLFLLARTWAHGSAPGTTEGATGDLPASLDKLSYARMVWQDQFFINGQVSGPLQPQQVDDEIRIQSQGAFGEPVLYLSIQPPAGGGRGWRSLTTAISTTGRDFTTVEFLEFYILVPDAVADSLTLVFDLGTVSEDAFVLDSDGNPSGLGRLDQEADRTTQIWSNADDVGLWGVDCTAERGVIAYPLNDERANCSRNNGLNDSEDLNGDNQLQTDERYFRYTVRVGDPSSPYYVRDANTFEDAEGNPVARFRLFRIPLRRPDHIEKANFAEFQNVRHLRVTTSSGSSTPFVAIVARMRFLGSRWLKRGQEGVLRGLTDTLTSLNPSSLVEVGPISTVDPNYVSPPGIRDQLANQTEVFQTATTQFNEQSLRVRFRDLEPGERGEVYLQYPQTPRDMLTYRALRLWALGWEGDWGDVGDLRFFVKMGEDAGNSYLYRARLPAVPAGGSPTDVLNAWRPEIVVDFERFIRLRTAAEDMILRAGGLPGDSQLVLWDVDVFPDGDSTYAVAISQRSRPPNLAAIRQISLGVYNAGAALAPASELWVDDVRLDRASDDVGFAGQVHLNVRASDVLDFRASFEGQNPYFRQLGDSPGFQTGSSFNLGSTLRLGRFFPTAWGLDMPLALSRQSGGTDPFFLPRTDIRGEGLRDLRAPERSSWRADLSIRRANRAAPTPVVGWLVDRMSLRLSWASDRNQAQRSVSEGDRFSASLGYGTDIGNVSVPLLPSFLRPLFFFLPDAVRETQLRLTPRALSFGADFGDATNETRRFESILRLPGDTAVTPLRTFQSDLRYSTTLQLQPLPALGGRLSFSQSRDLVPSERLAAGDAARGLIDAERSSLLGVGLGWETQRNLSLSFNYRPQIAPWFTPSASWTSSFNARRNASYLGVEAPGDTVLQRDFDNSRRLQAGAQFNLNAFASALSGGRGGLWGALRGASGWVDILQLNWSGSVVSDFRRQTADPGFGYQLALGGAESFRVVGADTATRVIEGEAWSAGSGLILPIGAVLSADYRVSEGKGWTPLSQNASETVDWPNLQFNWSRVPLPSFLRGAVRNITLRVGYSERETRDRNFGADQLRLREETRIPASLSIGLTTGWTFSYALDRSESFSVDPTGRSEGERLGHTVRILAQLRPPASWRSLRSPIRINLGYRRDETDSCRALGISSLDPETPESCSVFTDLTVQKVDLTVDTDVQPFTFGLQASWRDQQSEIGQRPGSTQLNVSVFARFLFQSGPIR